MRRNCPSPITQASFSSLNSIRDPGNLGTLLRSAEAAGVQAVLLPPETVDAFAPKVVRAGMGAHFRLPMRSMSWDEIRAQTADVQLYLAEMQGTALLAGRL